MRRSNFYKVFLPWAPFLALFLFFIFYFYFVCLSTQATGTEHYLSLLLICRVVEYHVDGFRFDLASVLCRGTDGTPLDAPPLVKVYYTAVYVL